MRRELVGSACAHAVLFAMLVWVSAPGTGLPSLPPGDIVRVTPVDALPAGMLKIPEVDVPGHAEDVAVDEPANVAIPEPEVIPVEPKPTEAETKPRPRAEVQIPPVEEAVPPAETENTTPSDGVYESKVQSGAGSESGGSLLGLKGGTPGGRPATYPDRVTNKVYYTWRNPAKLPDTIRCSVIFRLGPDGRASQIALERSSGMPVFDNSTLRAVYEAAPYPPFPRSMKEEYIVMRIIFEYLP